MSLKTVNAGILILFYVGKKKKLKPYN